jgi:hypothetical protein
VHARSRRNYYSSFGCSSLFHHVSIKYLRRVIQFNFVKTCLKKDYCSSFGSTDLHNSQATLTFLAYLLGVKSPLLILSKMSSISRLSFNGVLPAGGSSRGSSGKRSLRQLKPDSFYVCSCGVRTLLVDRYTHPCSVTEFSVEHIV